MKLVKIILMSLVLLLNHIFATAETTVASSSAHDNNPNADKTLEQIMKTLTRHIRATCSLHADTNRKDVLTKRRATGLWKPTTVWLS